MKLNVQPNEENQNSKQVHGVQKKEFKLSKDGTINDEEVKKNEKIPSRRDYEDDRYYGTDLKNDNGNTNNTSDYSNFSDEETITEDAVDGASDEEEFQDIITDSNYDDLYDANDYTTTFSEYEDALLQDKNFNMTSYERKIKNKTKIEDNLNSLNKNDPVNLTINFQKQSNLSNLDKEEHINSSSVILCYLFVCLFSLAFIIFVGYIYKTLKKRISSNERTDRYILLLRHSK